MENMCGFLFLLLLRYVRGSGRTLEVDADKLIPEFIDRFKG